MIFLSAKKPDVCVTAYDARYWLQPLTYPEINPGHILAMEDEMGHRILQKNNGSLQKISFDTGNLPGFPKILEFPFSIPSGSRVLLFRGGGIGDVLMCTPALRALRRHLPSEVHMTLSTFKSNEVLFRENPHLDAVASQPVTLDEVLQADYYLEFKDPEGLLSRLNMIDFYLKAIGLDPDTVQDKRLELFVERPKRVSEFFTKIRNGGQPIIYLNGLASDPLRDLPPKVLSVFPKARKESVFLVPEQYLDRYGGECADLIAQPNVRGLDTNHSLQEYIGALSASDGIITTDSSAYHIAAAMEKPCMALFGPVDSNLRTTYYPTVVAVDSSYRGNTCNSPCNRSMFSEFYSGRTDGEKRCPEGVDLHVGFSPCLASFPPERLLSAFDHMGKPTGKEDEFPV